MALNAQLSAAAANAAADAVVDLLDGGTLRILSTGLKDCTGDKPAVCWR